METLVVRLCFELRQRYAPEGNIDERTPSDAHVSYSTSHIHCDKLTIHFEGGAAVLLGMVTGGWMSVRVSPFPDIDRDSIDIDINVGLDAFYTHSGSGMAPVFKGSLLIILIIGKRLE
ncbi:hypothetical protein L1987_06534 [Smallanthus sonchifolius]|uniref:Uncharacterized protein n=1 Tax=Smallanthus sonchifolius TaxID=185202 RepID=A0ACB9JYF3_9ASTR|nr:hypothetical protein L1987_06534 [Smallanthus sonchifolius]